MISISTPKILLIAPMLILLSSCSKSGFFGSSETNSGEPLLSSKQIISGSADGSSSSLISNGETNIKIDPPENTLWSDFTIDLGADFLESNICSGKIIFGRSGSALCGATAWNVSTLSLDSANIGSLNGSIYSYSANANVAHSTINLDMGADFTTLNFCSGKTVLGLAGSANCIQGSTISPGAAGDILLNKEAWMSNGTKVIGTMPNHATWDLTLAFPSAGYFSAVSNAPSASQFCNSATSGQNILGISGTAVCQGASGGTNAAASEVLAGKYFWNANGTSTLGTMPASTFGDLTSSNMYRNTATTQMNLALEKSTTSYASGYREIPDTTKDDDGYDASSPVVKATRPSVTCGTTQNTLAARIADCLAQNGTDATWDGAVKGISGEGVWKLVTRTSTSKEVWRDERTGLLWGDNLGAKSWCEASGNTQTNATDGTGNGDCDPANFFNKSVCVEGGSLAPAIAGENWTSGTYDNAKGAMGAISSATSPSVRWRLPTRNDWYQADINGIRFVLPNMAVSFWTASTHSLVRGSGITFSGHYGVAGSDSKFNPGPSIRCIGR
ncbi:MAG: hypothetical protein KBD76_13720 [Bacteriovorax sp.]|nr:hypothetical protein [Bacteriovorax sp.]